MLAHLLGQLLGWAALGASPWGAPADTSDVRQPTEVQDARGDRGIAPPRQCEAYCRSYLAACADSIAFASGDECEATCAGWQQRTDDGLACRVAFLEPGARSCIAAGPASPICQR